MPDVIAANSQYLSNFLPPDGEPITDPLELATYVAKKLDGVASQIKRPAPRA